ncbi:MAG: cell division protein FtsZ [Campylobacteraceae bacterium 4484_4]|nr:MAG: cell division protein FtsZ [Campylobacteraceae bacterium 4484_4]
MSNKQQVVGAQIKVIGVGGGGGNMINHMISEGIGEIDLIAANTDAQALEASLANRKLQLGERKTRGLGAGMKPEIGRNAAMESYDDIKEALEGADIVFIASGLGGGTGTGASPVVAQAAKEVGALTVSVVTKPFSFEGRKRSKLATEGIEELKKESDSIVVIPNDKLLSIVDKHLGIKESFKLVDNILSRAVGGMSSVVLSYGENDINLDFADVQTVMSHKGMAILGVGEAEGDDAAIEAVKNAIESPLLDNMSINGAMGVLVHFHIHPNFPLTQIQSAMDIIYDSADEDADVIFGTTTNENLAENEVKITIVATGFEQEGEKRANIANNIECEKPAETPKEQPIAGIRRRIANADYDLVDDDLDYPTFLRRQMD